MRYGKVAPALCFIRMKAINSETSLDDVIKTIRIFSDAWYSHRTIADGEFLWRVHSGYDEVLERLQRAYCESGGNYEIGVVLDVFSALQWNSDRMQAIQRYLDDDEL